MCASIDFSWVGDLLYLSFSFAVNGHHHQRKKVIFLHWFHHTTVLLYCWHAFHHEIAPGIWFAAMNYGVHMIM